MGRLGLLFLFCFLFSCNGDQTSNPREQGKAFYLKSKIANSNTSEFFRDYDVFKRKGIDKINSDSLQFPFFQVYLSSDTVFTLRLYNVEETTEYIIPKANQTVYSMYDIYDGPRHIFSKIEGNKIIRYGYSENPLHAKEVIAPTQIEVITQDTFYTFFSKCLDTAGIKGSILPFKGILNTACDDALVQYFASDSSNSKLHHYYKNLAPNVYAGKNNPGDGIYGFKRNHKFWRDFFDLKR